MALPDVADQIVTVALLSSVLFLVSRPVIDLRVRKLAGTVAIGVLVFAIWVLPDYAFPGYRDHWLFSNSLMGAPSAGLSEQSRGNAVILLLRAARASVLVPLAEELFWRAWLMRRLISPDFLSVSLGSWSAQAFWSVAILFASEHGPYWDVGFGAGVIYNWWIVRTRSLGDAILAHGVTNACLSVYVVFGGRWEYWA